MRWIVSLLTVGALLAAPLAGWAADGRCPNGRSKNAAMWLSIAHPGVGEWFLNGWGSFDNAPQRKFWLGFIPFYGWPGYLQAKSAVDAKNCRTNDDI
jgi:MFS family permease